MLAKSIPPLTIGNNSLTVILLPAKITSAEKSIAIADISCPQSAYPRPFAKFASELTHKLSRKIPLASIAIYILICPRSSPESPLTSKYSILLSGIPPPNLQIINALRKILWVNLLGASLFSSDALCDSLAQRAYCWVFHIILEC